MINEIIEPILQKWVAVANIEENGLMLHRELEFTTEEECDAFIAGAAHEYEKIPVYKG